MRAPEPLHATPHGRGLIAVLLFVLATLLTGCADDPVMPSNKLDEAQTAFVVDECWNEAFEVTAMRTQGGVMILECVGVVPQCAP